MFSVIIPVYNERANLEALLERLERVRSQRNFEVIFVDDGSTDGTYSFLFEKTKSCDWITLVERGKKLGLASAVLTGVQVSFSNNFAVMDGDLQHPPELLPAIFDGLKEADIVIATRKNKYSMSGYRKAVSDFATFLAHLMIPKTRRVRDPLSGFFGFRHSVIPSYHNPPQGVKILLWLLAKGNYTKVSEVEFEFGKRFGGSSKFSFAEVARYSYLLFSLL
jgi:dolichol-phosphate mannosyltransferase